MTRFVRDDRGAVTALLAVLTVALLALSGLVIDGGRVLTARARSANHAEQAARAGANALNVTALRAGAVRADPVAARRAAQELLDRTGDDGSITVAGGTVTVTVRSSVRTVLLGVVGIQHVSVTTSATARPVRGTTSEARGFSVSGGSSPTNRSAGGW